MRLVPWLMLCAFAAHPAAAEDQTPSDSDRNWVLVPRTERVWASRFGDLVGISGIPPTRRVELLPYMAGASTVRPNRDPRNPFDNGRNLTSRVGADVKMGLGTNLTLDATVKYIATIAGGRPETFGSRYVFSFIDRSTVSTSSARCMRCGRRIDRFPSCSGRASAWGTCSAPSRRRAPTSSL